MATNSVNGNNPMFHLSSNQDYSSLGQQDLLGFMVAQIQNQEVRQGQAKGEFLPQWTHEGMSQMQESLQSNQALQASALVGRKVLVNCNTIKLDVDGVARTVIDMPRGISSLSASIYADSGELIKTISLEGVPSGFFQLTWDGVGEDNKRWVEGDYKIKVLAVCDEKEELLETLISANVDSVSLGQNGGGLKLNVAGIGAVSLDQVRQISV